MNYILERIKNATSKALINLKEGKKTQSLYLLIYNVIQNAIINDDIPHGSLLPSSRKLSESLNVSRSTIIKSYELLRLEGYIDSKGGSGHQVKEIGKKEIFDELKSQNDNKYANLSILGHSFMKNITLINSTDDKSIAFRPGLPPLDIFPVNQWKNLSNYLTNT